MTYVSLCDELTAALKARGERLTLQRRLVLDLLCDTSDHLTVGDLTQQLDARGAPLPETTIYRILQWLKDAGVVSQTDLGQRGIVYQIVGGPPHHHLVCLACGALIEIEDALVEPLREAVRNAHDFEPRIDHMAIFGLCADCRRAGATPPGDPDSG